MSTSAAAVAASPHVHPTGYTQILNSVLRSNPLKPGPRTLYTVLASYGWKGPKVIVSQKRLAEDLGISERTVRRYMRVLEEHGYIRTVEQQGWVNEYHLLIPYHPGQVARITEEHPRTARPQGTGQHDLLERTTQGTPSETRQKEELPISFTHRQLWEQASQLLAAELTKANFSTWIAPLRVSAGTPDCLTLATPSDYVLQWVETRLRSTLEKAVMTAAGRRLKVRLV